MDYNKFLSKKVLDLKPSGIRRFFDIANEMEGVISLGVGEPDFKTPYSVRQAGIETLEKGRTMYSANAGVYELREEICTYMKRRFNLEYDAKTETIVTVGGSEAIDLCIRAMIEPGDEVLIPEPCFVAYAPIVEISGGEVIPIKTVVEDKFKLTKAALEAAITEKTKLLVLPFPNNPTGAIMDYDDLASIVEVLKERDIMVLSDEIYAELTHMGHHVSIAQFEGMKEKTVIASGFSKAYSMTGWRLGYALGPKPIIEQMTKIHQYAVMCAPTTSQYAAIEALKNCDESVRKMAEEYKMRSKLITKGLNDIGLPCFEPEGAFYVFPDIRGTGMSSEEFCEKLLHSQKVALVPGNAFGDSGEGFVRISYAYSVTHILEALKRIKIFISTL